MESSLPDDLDLTLERYLDERLTPDEAVLVERRLSDDYAARERLLTLLGTRGLTALGGVVESAAAVSAACRRIRGLLPRYHRNQSSGREVAELSRHLEVCSGCDAFNRSVDPGDWSRPPSRRVWIAATVLSIGLAAILAYPLVVRDRRSAVSEPASSGPLALSFADGFRPRIPLTDPELSLCLDTLVISSDAEAFRWVEAFADRHAERLRVLETLPGFPEIAASLRATSGSERTRLATAFLTALVRSSEYADEQRGVPLAPLRAQHGEALRPFLVALATTADGDLLVHEALTQLKHLGSVADGDLLHAVAVRAQANRWTRTLRFALVLGARIRNDDRAFELAAQILESDPGNLRESGDLPVPIFDLARIAREHGLNGFLGRLARIARTGAIAGGRAQAACALFVTAAGETEKSEWRELLGELVRSEDESTRHEVAVALLVHPRPEDKEALILLANDVSERIRAAADMALDRLLRGTPGR